MITITDLLSLTVKCQAFDLHLSASMPPIIGVAGDIQKMNFPALSEQDLCYLLVGIMTDSQRDIVK